MIQLSNKTADWIAMIAREELIRLQEISNNIDSDIDELNKTYKDLCKGKSEDFKKVMFEKKSDAINKVTTALQEEKDKWNRIVELMLIGEKDGRD